MHKQQFQGQSNNYFTFLKMQQPELNDENVKIATGLSAMNEMGECKCTAPQTIFEEQCRIEVKS